MPFKRVDELYNAIGFNKHGKTELFRNLMAHLQDPDARFDFAEGDEGMVMAVFTLPAFNIVFKVIKDSFGAPKNTTRQAVMERYHFVFVRDRVGRLADAQEFEHLEFPRRCFPDDLLDYLLRVAGNTVRVVSDRVVVRHVYTERRVTPLNIFLRDAGEEAARDAVIEYGNAIKDLAAADIFTGDMLLKNFGVTRNDRVICYDYDELCLLSECRFRRIPVPTSIEEEFAAEPWFHVGEHDVFPEEFQAFLAPPGAVREAFLAAHGDLLDVAFWTGCRSGWHAATSWTSFLTRGTLCFSSGETSGAVDPSQVALGELLRALVALFPCLGQELRDLSLQGGIAPIEACRRLGADGVALVGPTQQRLCCREGKRGVVRPGKRVLAEGVAAPGIFVHECPGHARKMKGGEDGEATTFRPPPSRLPVYRVNAPCNVSSTREPEGTTTSRSCVSTARWVPIAPPMMPPITAPLVLPPITRPSTAPAPVPTPTLAMSPALVFRSRNVRSSGIAEASRA